MRLSRALVHICFRITHYWHSKAGSIGATAGQWDNWGKLKVTYTVLYILFDVQNLSYPAYICSFIDSAMAAASIFDWTVNTQGLLFIEQHFFNWTVNRVSGQSQRTHYVSVLVRPSVLGLEKCEYTAYIFSQYLFQYTPTPQNEDIVFSLTVSGDLVRSKKARCEQGSRLSREYRVFRHRH